MAYNGYAKLAGHLAGVTIVVALVAGIIGGMAWVEHDKKVRFERMLQWQHEFYTKYYADRRALPDLRKQWRALYPENYRPEFDDDSYLIHLFGPRMWANEPTEADEYRAQIKLRSRWLENDDAEEQADGGRD